jgi:aminoacylase
LKNCELSDLHIHCPGSPGHGSLLLDNTAGEKVAYLLNKFFTFRKQEKQKLKDNPSWTIGDVTTVNLTQMHVSKKYNYLSTSLISLDFVHIRRECQVN